jgi:tetraacyldisaccharide 4'-kinase
MLALAEALERGAIDGAWARALSVGWGRVAERSVVRRVGWPEGVRVVAVGGATLGGSGKTPLAIACAREIAAAGGRVVLVGHGFRARASRARFVSAHDTVDEVGDEALLAARCLDGWARVVVAPTRGEALELASRHADVLVLDGVAQTAPIRASLALLAVDPAEPWGRAAAPPPLGDLRAPRSALLRACDAVVPVGEVGTLAALGAGDVSPLARVGRPAWPARVVSDGAAVARGRRAGERISWAELATLRLGLLAALARPDRIIRQAAARGVRFATVARVRDHGPIDERAARACRRAAAEAGLDFWVASPKCTLHALTYAGSADALGALVATLDHSVVVGPTLRQRLRALALP